MTMEFSAKSDLLQGLAVGDQVKFDVTVKASSGAVTKIVKS